jgi:hypothetical protein
MVCTPSSGPVLGSSAMLTVNSVEGLRTGGSSIESSASCIAGRAFATHAKPVDGASNANGSVKGRV